MPKVRAIHNGTLNFTESVKLISEEDYNRLSRKIKPQRGDIIYSRIGARLGKARVVEVDERFLVSYSCCTVRPLRLNPTYLAFHLDRHSTLQRAIGDAQSIGVPDLGLDKIKRFPVPLCSEAEQEQISFRLKAIEKKSHTINSWVRELGAEIRKLDQSILAKAFRGELVPQDPNDEPAAVLLERIQAERAAQGNGKANRPSRGGR